MNGNELLEAMSFLDEKYIDEAEAEPKKRRLYRQPAFATVAAAACLTLVLAGVWKTTRQKQYEEAPSLGAAVCRMETEAAVSPEIGARTAEKTEANQAVDAAPMMVSVFARMTVQVVEQTEDAYVCIVTDPGTSGYEIRQQVTIVLPTEETAATMEPAAAAGTTEDTSETLYQVTFDPGEAAEVITAIEWVPME